MIRLELTGSTPPSLAGAARSGRLGGHRGTQFARETGTLWLDKVVFDLSDIARQAQRHGRVGRDHEDHPRGTRVFRDLPRGD